MGILKVNPDIDGEFTVASIVYFEWRLVDCYEWLRETLMNLKLDLFYEERQVLLFHRLIWIVCFSKTANIRTPFMRKREVVTGHVHILAHLLSHRSNDDRHAYFLAFHPFDLDELFGMGGHHHGAVQATFLKGRHSHLSVLTDHLLIYKRKLLCNAIIVVHLWRQRHIIVQV